MPNDFSPMLDQAFKLRELIQSAEPAAPAVPDGTADDCGHGRAGRCRCDDRSREPGGRAGRSGERVVLVDAARQHANMAQVVRCQFANQVSLKDVVNGRCRAADALVPGSGRHDAFARRGKRVS